MEYWINNDNLREQNSEVVVIIICFEYVPIHQSVGDFHNNHPYILKYLSTVIVLLKILVTD